MIETVEGFMGNGVEIGHLIEVDFDDFPKLIDALGGITVNVEQEDLLTAVPRQLEGHHRRGERHLDGSRALGYARVRKNNCAPSETDSTAPLASRRCCRGSGPADLPWHPVPAAAGHWQAPKALKSDMKGPALMALFTDLATGSSDATMVPEPSCLSCGPGGSLLVSDGAKRDAVKKLRVS